MDIRTALLAEHSLVQAKRIASFAAADEASLKELIDIFLSGNTKETQRAAWALSHFAEAQPERLHDYFPALLLRCSEPDIPDAAKRAVSRMLPLIHMDEPAAESALNLCFAWLEDTKETIAVRCFSMSALEHLTITLPELRMALEQSITHILTYEKCSAGIKSRAAKVLRQLRGPKKKRP